MAVETEWGVDFSAEVGWAPLDVRLGKNTGWPAPGDPAGHLSPASSDEGESLDVGPGHRFVLKIPGAAAGGQG